MLTTNKKLSERTARILSMMWLSGESETKAVCECLNTIAEERADDSHLLDCAMEIRDAATFFINRMTEAKAVIKLELPKCWETLVQTDFEVTGFPAESGGSRVLADLADPKPYYDDCRGITTVASTGEKVIVELCSGQSNYYANVIIESISGLPVYEEVWETLGDETITVNNTAYSFEVTWV